METVYIDETSPKVKEIITFFRKRKAENQEKGRQAIREFRKANNDSECK